MAGAIGQRDEHPRINAVYNSARFLEQQKEGHTLPGSLFLRVLGIPGQRVGQLGTAKAGQVLVGIGCRLPYVAVNGQLPFRFRCLLTAGDYDQQENRQANERSQSGHAFLWTLRSGSVQSMIAPDC